MRWQILRQITNGDQTNNNETIADRFLASSDALIPETSFFPIYFHVVFCNVFKKIMSHLYFIIFDLHLYYNLQKSKLITTNMHEF